MQNSGKNHYITVVETQAHTEFTCGVLACE